MDHVSRTIIYQAIQHLLTIAVNQPAEYLASSAQKEIEWTRRYGKSLELDFPHNGIFPGEKSPDDNICLLNKYLALSPYLLPKESNSPLTRPTLRHPGTSVRHFVHRGGLLLTISRSKSEQHLHFLRRVYFMHHRLAAY